MHIREQLQGPKSFPLQLVSKTLRSTANDNDQALVPTPTIATLTSQPDPNALPDPNVAIPAGTTWGQLFAALNVMIVNTAIAGAITTAVIAPSRDPLAPSLPAAHSANTNKGCLRCRKPYFGDTARDYPCTSGKLLDPDPPPPPPSPLSPEVAGRHVFTDATQPHFVHPLLPLTLKPLPLIPPTLLLTDTPRPPPPLRPVNHPEKPLCS